MIDKELLKVIGYLVVGFALFFALLYHYWNLEDAEE